MRIFLNLEKNKMFGCSFNMHVFKDHTRIISNQVAYFTKALKICFSQIETFLGSSMASN